MKRKKTETMSPEDAAALAYAQEQLAKIVRLDDVIDETGARYYFALDLGEERCRALIAEARNGSEEEWEDSEDWAWEVSMCIPEEFLDKAGFTFEEGRCESEKAWHELLAYPKAILVREPAKWRKPTEHPTPQEFQIILPDGAAECRLVGKLEKRYSQIDATRVAFQFRRQGGKWKTLPISCLPKYMHWRAEEGVPHFCNRFRFDFYKCIKSDD